MTTKEFFESEANDIIDSLQNFYGIQKNNKEKYVNVPFPTREQVLIDYENAVMCPAEELSDIDNFSDTEQEKMIQEQKELISQVYDRVEKIRDNFYKSQGIEYCKDLFI